MRHLPNEIWNMIAQFLEPEEEGSVQRNPTDLAALTRSCKAFHSILNPALYRYNVKFQGSSAVFTAIDKYGIHGNANATVGTLRACQNAGADWKTRRLEKVPQIFPFFRGRFIPDGNDVLEMSPLHLAARNGLDEAVVFLLEHEARIDDWDEREWTPLFVAIYYGRVSTVKLLIARGACLAPAGFRYNALHLAALSGETGVVNHIANLLDANAKDGNGCTPLIYTILSPSDGKYAAIRCLLDHGADPVEPVQRDYGVTTPLNEACIFDFSAAVVLLDAVTDVRRGEAARSPLSSALMGIVRKGGGRTRREKSDLIAKLLRLGADPNEGIHLRELRWAGPLLPMLALTGRWQEAEQLLETGNVDIDKLDWDGNTALTLTLRQNSKKAPLLLQHGAKPQDAIVKRMFDFVSTLPPPCYAHLSREAVKDFPGILHAYKAVYDHFSRIPPDERYLSAKTFLDKSPSFIVSLVTETSWDDLPSARREVAEKLVEYQKRFWTLPSKELRPDTCP